MTSPLENLSGPGGPLRKEPPDAREFANLRQSGSRRLADAENTTNSAEGRFDLAYNAAHAMCLAALRHAGYRPANRYIVFQVLPHTLGLGSEVWRVLAHSFTALAAPASPASRTAPASGARAPPAAPPPGL